MHRILSIYTFAAAVAVFLFILSPIFLLLYGVIAVLDAVAYLISGILVSLFIYDYMKYAVREWGEFAPQGASLAAFFVLAYAIMYMSLMALSLFGAGGLNLAVWASVMISAALMIYIMRHVPLHIVGTDPLTDAAAGVKTLPLALLVGFPLGWLIAAIYEAARMVARGAKIAGITVFVSLFLPFILLGLLMHVDTSAFVISVFAPFLLNAGAMQFTGIEVLAWPGIIGWEELTSRFMLPGRGAAGQLHVCSAPRAEPVDIGRILCAADTRRDIDGHQVAHGHLQEARLSGVDSGACRLQRHDRLAGRADILSVAHNCHVYSNGNSLYTREYC